MFSEILRCTRGSGRQLELVAATRRRTRPRCSVPSGAQEGEPHALQPAPPGSAAARRRPRAPSARTYWSSYHVLSGREVTEDVMRDPPAAARSWRSSSACSRCSSTGAGVRSERAPGVGGMRGRAGDGDVGHASTGSQGWNISSRSMLIRRPDPPARCRSSLPHPSPTCCCAAPPPPERPLLLADRLSQRVATLRSTARLSVVVPASSSSTTRVRRLVPANRALEPHGGRGSAGRLRDPWSGTCDGRGRPPESLARRACRRPAAALGRRP